MMGIPVDGFPQYIVNEDGTIFSKYTNKILKTNVSNNGYHSVELFNNGKSKRMLVHRLVASAFLENPNGCTQVNHKDENKSNNNVSNLEWCTPKYNMNYGKAAKERHLKIDYSKEVFKINAVKNGKKVSRPVCQFTKSGDFVKRYESGKEASVKTGINHSHIIECCRGKRYKTVGGYVWKYERGNDLLVSQS